MSGKGKRKGNQKKGASAKASAPAETVVVSDRSAHGILASRHDASDIKIENFSLSFHAKDLIVETSIELNRGRRYGLIGPNGCGKTTFLQSLAAREVPIPEHMDIQLLREEAAPTDRSALQTVVDEVEKEVKRLEDEEVEVMATEGPNSERLMDIYDRLEELEPTTLTKRAGELLHGLGFSTEMMNKKTREMSGGWRMRVSLARILLIKPSIMLLDEPTNHLDLEACVWLEECLKTYNKILILISHSQDFLNGVCTNIISIEKKKLAYYGGNYDAYVKTRQENEANQMKRFKKEQADIAHIKAFIASCGTYANLVRQAKSKQKIIDKMEEAGLAEEVVHDQGATFKFLDCGKLAYPVLQFDGVGFAYSGQKKDMLYSNLNLGVDLESRIALVGPNGAGKSTLLKLMVDEISPTEGNLKKNGHLIIGRYHQHSADALDSNLTPLEYMKKTFPDKKLDDEGWRSVIGRYGLTGTMQVNPIGTLSDGLKSRLVFAMISVRNPHILLLDEPTNHLDIEGIDALAQAINEFEGGLVLVSHDFRLINQVAKEIWLCDNKRITKWGGDISSYKQKLLKDVATYEAKK